ncbi:MAG TPA: ABC transporter permease [Gaiellaceae bacterium]|jgi:ABC-2 type transport system permease protein|nr:ABC transporter permease [Gaiellaceae bacterium]
MAIDSTTADAPLAPWAPQARSRPFAERFQEVQALARRWFLQRRRERLELASSIVLPSIWLVFFGIGLGKITNPSLVGTSDYTAFMLPGIIVFTIVSTGIQGALPLLWDKETGYLLRLMSMPISRSSVLLARFAFQLALGAVQALLVIAVALALGVDIETGVLGVLVVLFTASLMTIALTAVFAALVYALPGHSMFFALAGFVTLPLVLLSNAFVPLHAMPTWMEVIARANPLTYAIQVMRLVVIQGWTAEVGWSIGVVAAFAAVATAIGVQQFRQQTAERAI